MRVVHPGAAEGGNARTFLTLTLGLPELVDSPRIAVQCEPYPGRWTHHIVLSSPDEMDAELLAWIDRAHQFAQR